MHGITHEVKLDLLLQGTDTDPWGNERAGAEIQGVLSRKDLARHLRHPEEVATGFPTP